MAEVYSSYGISLTGNVITKVEVGIEAFAVSSENVSLEVSSNNGSSWKTPQVSSALGGSDNNTVTWLDFTSYVLWTPTLLNNTKFQVRLTWVTNGLYGQISVDWLPVRVSFSPCDSQYVAPVVTSPQSNYYEISVSGDKVVLGNILVTSEYSPEIKVGKWNNESWLSLTPTSGTLAIMGTFTNSSLNENVVLAENSNMAIAGRPTEPAIDLNELGGLDYIITYKTLPSSNTLSYTFDSQSVNAYLQHPLNEEIVPDDEIATVTETDAYDINGKLMTHRPDYVVNSIVFYHNSKSGNGYKDGKIGNLYRMKAVDAIGNWAWADWGVIMAIPLP